jgi:chromosomal replication initiator protein|tara:strand:+ start:325 stop:1680 length:1356 start_codon:yes stop_codon:yes gene_type:complete
VDKKQKYKSAWQTIKTSIKIEMPNQAFNTWIAPIRPVALNEQELILEVPNQFFYEWLDTHYKDTIKRRAVDNYGHPLNIKYTVSTRKNTIINHNDRETEKQKYKRPVPNFINKNHRFSSFIEGANNQFAKAAAMSVAQNPGESHYNPLVIYGGVGLGKTHLLHAIGNHALAKRISKKVVLETSERFTQEFINSIQKNTNGEFTKKYRNTDLLLIDDIQFFKGKEQTQEQFFHTFNELQQLNKQIVLSADTYPGDMRGLQERLVSRFQSGLSVDIQPPDFETRVAILLEKAQQSGLELQYDLVELIATHIKTNIRVLESIIIRLLANSSLHGKEINRDLVEEVIREKLGKEMILELNLEDVVKKVSDIRNFPVKIIVGPSRRKEIVKTRHLAMYLCRELTNNTLTSIGLFFGGRDHTTVIHACSQVEKVYKKKIAVTKFIDQISRDLSVANF